MNNVSKRLTVKTLIKEAKIFSEKMSKVKHSEIKGKTDGKVVGTYIEKKFKDYLMQEGYIFSVGNSANGIDLPGKRINTDIKVTSGEQPQSSCPFKSAEQKIYGLGYNLLIFVYERAKRDDTKLKFTYCTFVSKERTADYTTTTRLIEMVKDDAKKEDILSFLTDRCLPGDEIVLNDLAERILKETPTQGYLTISNALQWRLQYGRAIELNNTVKGVKNYGWK